jgi:hypothetical protein
MFRTRQNASALHEMGTRPARTFELRVGPRRIRLRPLTGSFAVRRSDGTEVDAISNRIEIVIPEVSEAAERDALVAQVSAGGADRMPSAQRLVERYPDAALGALEAAIAATADGAVRSRYVALAGKLTGDRATSFLLAQLKPGIEIASQVQAAGALLARGRDEGLLALADAWERVDFSQRTVATEARLLEFLAGTGDPRRSTASRAWQTFQWMPGSPSFRCSCRSREAVAAGVCSTLANSDVRIWR